VKAVAERGFTIGNGYGKNRETTFRIGTHGGSFARTAGGVPSELLGGDPSNWWSLELLPRVPSTDVAGSQVAVGRARNAHRALARDARGTRYLVRSEFSGRIASSSGGIGGPGRAGPGTSVLGTRRSSRGHQDRPPAGLDFAYAHPPSATSAPTGASSCSRSSSRRSIRSSRCSIR
jgi:hypothetical protein